MTPAPSILLRCGLSLAGLMLCMTGPIGAQEAAPTTQTSENSATRADFRFWMAADLGVLDPALVQNRTERDLVRQLFEGLTTEAPDGTPRLALASEISTSEDGLSVTITLRPEAKWSDGRKVTAEDLVIAWQRLADPATKSPHAARLTAIGVTGAAAIISGKADPGTLGLVAKGTDSIELNLTRRNPDLAAMLADPVLVPIPSAQLADAGADWAMPETLIGNGPYRIDSYRPGAQLQLTENPHYHDQDWANRPDRIARAEGVIVNDLNEALALYLQGELDQLNIAAGDLAALRDKLPDHVQVQPRACTAALLFNLSDSGAAPLKNPALRRALSLGFDREALISTTLQGGQTPAYSWTPPAIAGFAAPSAQAMPTTPPQKAADAQPDAPAQSPEITEAKAILSDLGYGPDQPLRLTLHYNLDRENRRIARAARHFWEPLGVKLRLEGQSWGDHAATLSKNGFQLARYGWCADENTPSAFLNWFAQDGAQPGGWQNDDYAALIEQLATAQDPQIAQQADAILAQEHPAIFLYHYSDATLLRPSITGWPNANAMGRWYLRDLSQRQAP